MMVLLVSVHSAGPGNLGGLTDNKRPLISNHVSVTSIVCAALISRHCLISFGDIRAHVHTLADRKRRTGLDRRRDRTNSRRGTTGSEVFDLLLHIEKVPWSETKLLTKALRGTQTLSAGCNKAEPKLFAPPQTPFPGARDGQSLISWRWSLPLPINPVW